MMYCLCFGAGETLGGDGRGRLYRVRLLRVLGTEPSVCLQRAKSIIHRISSGEQVKRLAAQLLKQVQVSKKIAAQSNDRLSVKLVNPGFGDNQDLADLLECHSFIVVERND